MQVVLERVALSRRPLGVEIQQFGRSVVSPLRRFLFCLFPLAAAELVQRCGFRRRTAVAADQMQARHRHVELGVVGVQQVQKLVLSVAKIERGQSQITTDTVLLVHDGIAGAKLRQVPQHGIDTAAPRFALAGSPRNAGVEFAFGNQRQLRFGPDKPGVHRTDYERGTGIARDKFGPVGDHCRLESVLGEILLHCFAASQAFRRNEDAFGRAGDETLQCTQRVVGTAVDLNRRQRLRADRPRSRSCGHRRSRAFGRRDRG